ncbi:hypothetical protein BDV34DRAFT_202966, partial [Aspergillus parasiticus]
MSNAGNLRTSCDLCRYRKVRCDRVKPGCETCQFAQVACTFTERTPRKTIREQLEETRAQLRQAEENQLRPTSLFDSRGFDAALAAFRWHLAYCVPYNLGDSLFNFDDLSRQLIQSIHLPNAIQTTKVIAPKWPSRPLAEQAIEYFSCNKLYAIFPVVDIEALTVLVDSDVLDQNKSSFNAANRACIVAFVALISRLRRHEPGFAEADPDAYIEAALSLLPQLTLEHTNIRALEALLLLALYIAPLGQPQTAEILLAMAVRVLYNLGGNINANVPRTPSQARYHQHLRALFWLCYCIDKEMSLRKCQAPLINDADCDLDLPANYVPLSSDHQFFTYPLSSHELLYPTDLRLALLKSKIYLQLHSHQSRTHSEARRFQLIRELDQELNDLKSQFPITCQPEAFANGDIPDSLFHDLSLRGVSMHLEHYHCLAKVHGASISASITERASSLPSSSIELCYQAARSTLLYIGRVRHLINPETFWIYAQFLLTALLSLYWHLITKPAEAPSQDDIRIMENMLGIFVELQSVNNGRCFPPFIVMEAFIRNLIISINR